jgi:hypothetical protein
VQDLKGLLDSLEIERAALVAQSMGDAPAWGSRWLSGACSASAGGHHGRL